MPHRIKKDDERKHIKLWGKDLYTKFVFMEQTAKKLKNNYSVIIGICGPQRVGKSFIGVWIAYQVYKLTGKEFDPTKITFYDPVNAIKELKEKQRDVLMIDEAGDVMDYQEWHSKTHRALRAVINTQSYKTNVYIFISPFLHQIDKSLRVHIDYVIDVKSRGRFLAHKAKKWYMSLDANNASRLFPIDNGGITMKHVPGPIWKRYLDYSIMEKEKLRDKRLREEEENRKLTETEKLAIISSTPPSYVRIDD